jgi:thymidylate kinase
MRALRKNRRTKCVSFSGIDGAGKSTQIEALCTRMKEDGLRVLLIRFWDDIATLTRLREDAGHRIFKGDKGVGSPSAPIERRDKNVSSWPMTSVRLFLYFIDAISVRLAVEKALHSEADLVVFDRYIYDELANLTLSKPFVRAYVRLIMKIVPKPDISYLLNADPVAARARKPEYPLEFLNTNRQSYLDLCELVGGMTVIAPMSIFEVERAVLGHARNELSFRTSKRESDGATNSTDYGDEPAESIGPQTRPTES